MVKKKNKMKKLAALFSVILLLAAFTCLSAFAEGNEAKIGETEYATLDAALGAAKADDTVTLLQDVTFSGNSANRRGIIDGAGHKLTLMNRILVGDYGNLTLKNITVDLSQFSETNTAKQDAFAVYSKTLTFEDGVIITGAANNLSNIVRVAGANSTFNMTGGSIENCSVNFAVVRVHDNDGSKATISGGSIKNNAVQDTRAAVYLEKGTLTITGNPEITGNHKKGGTTLFNVNIIGGTFNVEAPFTGKIGVRLNTGGNKGTVIGNAVGDLTLSEDSIVRDGIPTLIGYVSNGKVILDNKKNAAKIGETEYATLADALGAAAATDTVTLLKDVTYEGDGSTNRRGIIDGGGHKLTLKNRILVGTPGNLTLKNITVDLSQFSETNTAKQDAFAVYSNTLTFEDGVIITGAANNLSNVVRVAGATSTFNMTGGSIEDCSVNYAVVRVHDNDGSKATISGGSIKNNAVPDVKGAVLLERGTLTVSGNPEITGNHKKDATTLFNVNIISGTFNVEAPFTGKIGVRLNTGGNAGDVIGNAVGGLTLSADSIVRDGKPELIGYVSGGKVKLNNKITLTPVIDMGKYTAADNNTYGVVRVNTYVDGITDAVTLEKVGTYFYKTTDNGKATTNTVEIDPTNVASGNGYMADVYHVNDPTATVYAVNFYKLQGIEGYIFSALEPISYNVNAVKSVDYAE